MLQPAVDMSGEDLGNWPFIRTAGFRLGCLQDDPPSITDPANCRPTRNSAKLPQPNGAKRKKSDHQAVAHQPSAGKVGEMSACFTPPDQLEPKRQQPVGRDDAMIFGPRPRLVAEIGLDLPQPDKVASRVRGSDDSPNSCRHSLLV